MVADGSLDAFRRDRRRLLESLQTAGISDLAILHAFDEAPRHHFVPAELHTRAYEDAALPIGHGQTISRPSVHALHLELARIRAGDRVLEVGTGSGFQTALIALLGASVYSIEVVRELSAEAGRRLVELGIEAELRVGDGGEGWPAQAPFDAILVGAAAPSVPGALLAQLAEGGRLVIPVGGGGEQTLYRYRREGGDILQETVSDARFVPLVGDDRG